MTLFFSILADVIIVAILVLFTVFIAKQGFAVTVHYIGKTWLSLFISMVISPLISTVIHDLFLSDTITNGIFNTLNNIVSNNPNGYSIAELFATLPEGFVSFLSHLGISLPELEAIYGPATEASEEILFAIAERIALPTADTVSSIVSYGLGFIIPYFFFKWINAKIRNIKNCEEKGKLFLLRMDTVCGVITGFGIGAAVVILLCTVVFTIFQIIMAFNAQSAVMEVYNRSFIFRFISSFDILGIVMNLFS